MCASIAAIRRQAGSRTPEAAGSDSRPTLPPRTSRSSTARNLPLQPAFVTSVLPPRVGDDDRRRHAVVRVAAEDRVDAGARATRASGRRPCRCAKAAPRPARPCARASSTAFCSVSSWMPNVHSGRSSADCAIGVYGNACPTIATGTPLTTRIAYGGNTGSPKSAVRTFCATKSILPAKSVSTISLTRSAPKVNSQCAGHDVDAEQLLRRRPCPAPSSTARSRSLATYRRRPAATRRAAWPSGA